MAINVQKFLPSSKGGTLAKVNETIIKSSSAIALSRKPLEDLSVTKSSSSIGGLSRKSLEDLSVIKVKVIEIDSILKGTLASEKKKLNDAKKQESSKRREKIEEKLETKPKVESGNVKTPSLPRMGFLDWVKNFIGNVILGYFVVRLVDHLPKIIPIVKFLGQAADFVINVGGKLLDGLVTFIDWGYKAYDATRGFVKNLFGNGGVKQFDQLSSALNQFLNLAIIAGMAVAGSGGFGGKGGKGVGGAARPRPGSGGRPRVTTSGGGSASRPDIRNPLRQKPKVTTSGGGSASRPDIRNPLRQKPKVTTSGGGNKGLLRTVRPFLKRIPLPVVGALIDFGLSVALGENPGRAAFRAIGAGLLGTIGGGLAGVLGLAGGPLAVATGALGAIAGGTLGDMAGGAIYDVFFGSKKPTSKIVKKAGGGITRGGKSQGGVRRTISSGRKGKYKRVLAPRKPDKVEIKPGSDVGGEDKILGLFPNPLKAAQRAIDVINPFNVVKTAGEDLGNTDYFGPILAITSKILLGQKPTSKDYNNVGLGINMLISKGINDGKLRGGLAAFAEGGFVDPKTLDAISQGGDISNWVAKTFQGEIESNAQKTLRKIQENLRLKKPGGDEKTPPSPDDMGKGGGVQVSSDSPDFWLLATAALFENSDPQGAADVAQAIYNRVAMPGDPWNVDNSIKKTILNPGQFQPVSDYASPSAWAAIKTKEDAVRFVKSQGKTQAQLETVAAAILDKSKQQSARQFVGPRDSFRSYAFEDSNNHLANETEVRRFGHAFGFEPRGATIGQFKAGKLSAAQVNANIKGETTYTGDVVGTVNQKGLPPLPPTNTLPGKQHYGAQRDGGRRHAGVDFDAPDNGTFYSRIGGEVIYSANAGGGYGNVVDIYNKKLGVTERIAEGSANLVRIGQTVSAGTPVQRGTHQTGVFHYEVRRGKATGSGSFEGTMDPIKFLSGASKYQDGGLTLGHSHMAMLGEKGKEFVIDADSTSAIEQTFPGFLGAINKAKYKDAINVLSNFASYESGAEQTIVIPEIQVNNIGNGSDYSSGSSSGSFSLIMAGGDESDPFDSLYIGG